MESLTDTLARRSVERSFADRRATYAEEIRRIVDATYRVIRETGGVDPTLRDILSESGLSTQSFYKHFRSKDELMLLLLDDGRRKLVGYLSHRMDKASTPAAKIRAWIEGVLHQAADPEAAARTRPFVAGRDRLAEQFPAQQQASVDLLVGLLAETIAAAPGAKGETKGSNDRARRDAEAIYDLAFAALHRHLTHGTKPSAKDVEHLVRFCVNATSRRKA